MQVEMKRVVITGSFDNLRSGEVRFLEEASKLGKVHLLLWSDEIVRSFEGKNPKFPEEERYYLLQAIRHIDKISLVTEPFERDVIPQLDRVRPDMWVVDEQGDHANKRSFCEAHNLKYRVLTQDALKGFPVKELDADEKESSPKRVVVTGCYDWFHSGHVRFFEEVSELGDLYVVVGHDANITLLKGPGHPLFPQEVRRYMVQSVRYVKQALISSGSGWMDAEPEIKAIRPHIYAVNEDGDKPEKREFCEQHGLEYIVLKRTPKEGLPKRESTTLRGF